MLKEKTLSPVRPNVGLEVAYRRALDEAVAKMHRSLIYWLRAAYRRREPEAMALDASPARELDQIMRRLARRWQAKFDELAPELARFFAARAEERSTSQMQAALRRAGFTVRFRMSPAANDALQAVAAENVGLIRSIAQQHLTEVQGIMMRSVARGHDLGYMTRELEERFGVTRRRAALIARDQNAKATAVIAQVRQRELGITEAIWMHSHAGRHPRPSHVAADGRRFDVAQGCLIDGEYILPGQLVNCRCVSRPVLPGVAARLSGETSPANIRTQLRAA